jgi:hypothetical protein
MFLARQKLWLRTENINIKGWCRERRKWDSEDFRKHVYIDEIKLQIGAGIEKRDDNQDQSLPKKIGIFS